MTVEAAGVNYIEAGANEKQVIVVTSLIGVHSMHGRVHPNY